MSFKENFVWGAATAAYQIEGAAYEDGRTASVWDRFCDIPGKIKDGSSGLVACDHYHRYREDVALMSSLGLQAYRFSLSWSRVMPDGTGAVNAKGLGFYDRLVDELLAKGITPYATLFHWDLPHALFLRGGWMNPDIPRWFADYAAVVADRLSDRVKHWFTLNEPQCFIGMGLHTGTHAPGLQHGLADSLQALHHALLAHGRSVQALRARARGPVSIGVAPTGSVAYPLTTSPQDVEAAAMATFAVATPSLWNLAWYADPMLLGRYPEEGLRTFGKNVPVYPASDLAVIHQPLDFCGINLYNGWQVRAGSDGRRWEDVTRPQGAPLTALKWPITPEVLYWGPRFFHERYALPICITENGVSCHDWVDTDGEVRDYSRVDFLRRYLLEFRRAAEDGVPLHGYFVWSLLDNFEWAEGYRERFGLVHVDYKTQVRTPKLSAKWYAGVIDSNGAALDSRLDATVPLFASS